MWVLLTSVRRGTPALGMCGRALGSVQGPEALPGSETGTLTGVKEEAVEGAAAQLILV